MQHPFRILIVVFALVLATGAAVAYAQDEATFDTSFGFRVGKELCQPGKYVVRVNEDQMGLTITPAKGAPFIELAMTRLAAPEVRMAGVKVVFDKVGDVYYLSEVWLPGIDGFLLHSTKERHTHTTVTAIKKD
ncbi:MAG: hypothetical protein H6Q10_2145 [Acidobacteria bacterium]|nr:hypothetical protein [Acidobacteriota bacterium]